MASVDYIEVLADLERRKAELEVAIVAIRRLANLPAPGPLAPVVEFATPSATEAPRAFPLLGMTIPEATIAHLRAAQRPLSTYEVIAALKQGGLRGSNYQTVYQVLRRRAREKQDLSVDKGKWHLAEWHKWRRKQSGRAEAPGDVEHPRSAQEN
ncbi:MAG: hypothetical protein K2X03_05105 [Bryobacteraceae bacterium]|nr:hypothetical protein [Bryobacteraceae bacterium]